MGHKILAVMPCRGRLQMTLDLIPRLRDTANDDFDLVCVVDNEPRITEALSKLPDMFIVDMAERSGYWKCLAAGLVTSWSKAPLIVNLANDLLPGMHWLRRAHTAYQSLYHDGEGMIGFADGIHSGEMAAHFLIARSMLRRWYGEMMWPVCYQHEYGDLEISERAQDEGKFAVAHWATLYHNHYYTGQQMDQVYADGQRTRNRDYNLFEMRKAEGWPPLERLDARQTIEPGNAPQVMVAA